MERMIKSDEVQEILDKIAEAHRQVRDIVKGTSLEGRFRAYGGFGFTCLLGEGNPYDDSLKTIIEELKKEGL